MALSSSSQLLSLPSESLLRDPSILGDLGPLPLLLLSLLPVGNVEGGIFSRITMTSMTQAWYLRLSHFEAILVGIVVLQIFVLSYLTILPLDITKLIEDGTLLGTNYSKKKRAAEYSKVVEQQRLAETMFSVLRRLDEDDCFLRTLCELEFNRNKEGTLSYPKGISELLGNLKRLGNKRIRRESMLTPNNVTITERKVLSEFEDAVLFGSGENGLVCDDTGLEEKTCESRYSLCGANADELLDYVKKMEPFLL